MASRVVLPESFTPRRLGRRAAQTALLIAAFLAVALLAPGLGEVRARLHNAQPGWLVLAVVFEALSCLSYVLVFRPVFCPHMSRRTAGELALSELGVGALVSTSGAAGLALGAWVLRKGGMTREQIARRSVAFFLLTSAVNFAAVALVGTLAAAGLGPHLSSWLTVLPASLAAASMLAVVAIARLGSLRSTTLGGSRGRRWTRAVLVTLRSGSAEAVRLARSRNLAILVGAVGYWAFDNAVLWAAFAAFGPSPDLVVVLLGYLIGQLGGLIPLPGGIGGIDGGLIGALIVYGAPVAVTVAAVLAYRLILFWLPLIAGAVAFTSLRRGLNRPDRPDLCEVPVVSQPVSDARGALPA